jgi:hypothetical protein
MDTLDLRMRFRESIRKKTIEEVQKVKRRVQSEQNERQIAEQRDSELYRHIITNS